MKNQNLYAVVELKYDINTDEFYEVIMAMFGNKENAEEYIKQENEIRYVEDMWIDEYVYTEDLHIVAQN